MESWHFLSCEYPTGPLGIPSIGSRSKTDILRLHTAKSGVAFWKCESTHVHDYDTRMRIQNKHMCHPLVTYSNMGKRILQRSAGHRDLSPAFGRDHNIISIPEQTRIL